MNNPHRARFWGIKAAQAGLSEKSNPYQTADNRQAWIAGYRQMRQDAGLAGI